MIHKKENLKLMLLSLIHVLGKINFLFLKEERKRKGRFFLGFLWCSFLFSYFLLFPFFFVSFLFLKKKDHYRKRKKSQKSRLENTLVSFKNRNMWLCRVLLLLRTFLISNQTTQFQNLLNTFFFLSWFLLSLCQIWFLLLWFLVLSFVVSLLLFSYFSLFSFFSFFSELKRSSPVFCSGLDLFFFLRSLNFLIIFLSFLFSHFSSELKHHSPHH